MGFKKVQTPTKRLTAIISNPGTRQLLWDMCALPSCAALRAAS
jgi:hypothetical protein